MKIYNLGSINVDYIYSVPHFVKPGETLASTALRQNMGGKGANQSIAIARAGAHVVHIGSINTAQKDSVFSELEKEGIDTKYIHTTTAEPTGHAIIQVAEGGNSIIIHGGANQSIREVDLDSALAGAEKGDWFLTQNETSLVPLGMSKAKAKDMYVVYNPAPMKSHLFEASTPSESRIVLKDIDLLIVNELEARELAKLPETCETKDIIDYYQGGVWQQDLEGPDVILTLGSRGVVMIRGKEIYYEPSVTVERVDTTAAGDTFIGYFMAAYTTNRDKMEDCLAVACQAAAITVTRIGAIEAIPTRKEVEVCLDKKKEESNKKRSEKRPF